MAAGRALVNALGQAAHGGNAIGNLLAQEHAAATGLGALPDHHLDGIGLAQIVRVHAVARGEILVDEILGLAALFRGHAAIARRRRGAGHRGAAAERFLGLGRERTEAHAGDGDRDLEFDGLLGKARAQHHVGAALLAVAFQRIARDRGAEEQQIVEMRQLSLGAGTADVIDAGGGGAADFGHREVVEGCRLAWRGAWNVGVHLVSFLSKRRRDRR